jgi:hypothetical protein
MSTKTVRGRANPFGEMIATCDDMIKTFNATTHSIDTHISDYLGRKVGYLLHYYCIVIALLHCKGLLSLLFTFCCIFYA